ncbi:MAG: hypothetical protein MUF71_19730 [Candidatus Kapabacteria bacterium]|nr:hypothetical protein [Candidatus Kapabacteria bacterium]
MTAFRVFQRPQNGSLTVIVPEELRNTLCEIIVLPNEQMRYEQMQFTPSSSPTEVLAAYTGTAPFPHTDLGATEIYEQ